MLFWVTASKRSGGDFLAGLRASQAPAALPEATGSSNGCPTSSGNRWTREAHVPRISIATPECGNPMIPVPAAWSAQGFVGQTRDRHPDGRMQFMRTPPPELLAAAATEKRVPRYPWPMDHKGCSAQGSLPDHGQRSGMATGAPAAAVHHPQARSVASEEAHPPNVGQGHDDGPKASGTQAKAQAKEAAAPHSVNASAASDMPPLPLIVAGRMMAIQRPVAHRQRPRPQRLWRPILSTPLQPATRTTLPRFALSDDGDSEADGAQAEAEATEAAVPHSVNAFVVSDMHRG